MITVQKKKLGALKAGLRSKEASGIDGADPFGRTCLFLSFPISPVMSFALGTPILLFIIY